MAAEKARQQYVLAFRLCDISRMTCRAADFRGSSRNLKPALFRQICGCPVRLLMYHGCWHTPEIVSVKSVWWLTKFEPALVHPDFRRWHTAWNQSDTVVPSCSHICSNKRDCLADSRPACRNSVAQTGPSIHCARRPSQKSHVGRYTAGTWLQSLACKDYKHDWRMWPHAMACNKVTQV